MVANLPCHSNMQCFLDSTTPSVADSTAPSVASQSLPKSCMRDLNSLWQPIGKEDVEYFSLGDLRDQYNEWSTYGSGLLERKARVILGVVMTMRARSYRSWDATSVDLSFD